MEYYRIGGIPHILANAAWGDDRPNHAIWDAKRTPFEHFLKKDPQWAEKFHVWRFDWDKKHLAIYLDDEILNYVPIETIRNGKIGEGKNPFQLDSGEPNGKLREYMMGEVRFASLTRTFPERAETLFTEAERFTAHRYAKYKRLAGQT